MPDQETRSLSFGELAVGLSFNPSGDPQVTDVKQACAKMINSLHDLKRPEGLSEWQTELYEALQRQALDHLVSAQMAAVKLLTFKV